MQQVGINILRGRGATPEELAKRAAEKIVGISIDAEPHIKEQALAFRKKIEAAMVVYLREAAWGERTTIYNAIKNAGNPELAKMIMQL